MIITGGTFETSSRTERRESRRTAVSSQRLVRTSGGQGGGDGRDNFLGILNETYSKSGREASMDYASYANYSKNGKLTEGSEEIAGGIAWRDSGSSSQSQVHENQSVSMEELPLSTQLKLQIESVRYLFQLFFGAGRGGPMNRFSMTVDAKGNILSNGNLAPGNLASGRYGGGSGFAVFPAQAHYAGSIQGGRSTLGVESRSQVQESLEEEEMTYETTGTVITGDGKEIQFSLSASMSYHFYQKTNFVKNSQDLPVMDPLVIHLSDDPVGISDQKFRFDLDADGEAEEVSALSAGSAFLALDLDGNGRIDDGRELFGTKSGDGFSDLAQYDTDGNGWIDELDEVFGKLRVFSVDADGNQTLLSLSEAGVGAISLHADQSGFSVKDDENRTLANIRKSGFFLFESGRAGLLHQMDLAVGR